MNKNDFTYRLNNLKKNHVILIKKKNEKLSEGNGIYERFKYPIISADHTPLFWRYDFNPETNPYLMERLGINSTFNSGAIYLDGKYLLVVRVEGTDRKSFFAVAESDNGFDNFEFWDYPIYMPENDFPDTNIYDMRVVQHEDGWIYGIFCTERRDPRAPNHETTAAIASCGIARTKDLIKWERLKDLKTLSNQQRNVVLHPEFVDGKYALYTRPQDGFIKAGKGGGIGWALTKSMTNASVKTEKIIDPKVYHTIYESKNGLGPSPIKTKKGWLHLAHGVRETAAGLRYVLYMFLCDLNNPAKIINKPSGYFLAPETEERVGDVSNVVFCNGWIVNKNSDVFIYYASADTRMHVATSTIDRLLDYVINTPEDGYRSAVSVVRRNELIKRNRALSD